MNTGTPLDLPRGVRRLLLTAAAIGVLLVVAGSLVGHGRGSIGVDKLIHFSAYTSLGAVLVLGLPLRFAMPALGGLALTSYGVEFVQPLNGRSRDIFDAWANTAGVGVGAGVGLVARWLGSYLWTELQQLHMRRTLRTWAPGQSIFVRGQELHRFWVIREGSVEIQGPQGAELRGAGDILALDSELLNMPSLETAVSRERTVAWEINVETLIEEGGGPDQPLAAVLRALVKQGREFEAVRCTLPNAAATAPATGLSTPEAG